MKLPRPLHLLMVPLVGSLTLAVCGAAAAAPSKKTPPATAPAVEAPAPKRQFLKKLNPFRQKDPPPAPTPAPPPVPAKISKKSPQPTAPATAPIAPAKPPGKPLADAKPLPLAPSPEPAKPPGFFSRLKAKLDGGPEAIGAIEKMERPADWKERWVVSEESTAFYEFGPSQANGPDLRLARGQIIKLSQASRGWARVELEGGRKGYIGTDQMRQAQENDFLLPKLLPATQLAAAGSPMQGWSPAPPPPDLPDLPMAAGMEDALLLLPPLEFEGTELKKSSLKLPAAGPPTLKPGDSLPLPNPSPPVLDLEEKPAGAEAPPAPADTPATPAAAPAAPDQPAAPPVPPAGPETPTLPAPSEPTVPT